MNAPIDPSVASETLRRQLEDDAVLATLGHAAFAGAIARTAQARRVFAERTALAVREAMSAERARLP